MLVKIFCIQIRSSRPEVFLEKGVLKICSKFRGEHPCRSAISVKFQSNIFFKDHVWMAASGIWFSGNTFLRFCPAAHAENI